MRALVATATIIITNAVALIPAAASAHVIIEPTEARANATVEAVLRVPHGCGGEATHTLRVALPDGFYGAKPVPKAGWTLEIVTGADPSPPVDHGATVSESLREIVWCGGRLDGAHFDTFAIRGRVGDLASGTALPLVVTQDCANGSVCWDELAAAGGDAHDLQQPAPAVTVVDGAAATVARAGAASVGPLTVDAAWTRATPPGADVAAGYMTITNTGSTPDRLLGGSASFARELQVHDMAVDGGLMRMDEAAGGLVVAPGETVRLEPGGSHVMFMDLLTAPKAGGTVTVTLRFEVAGEVTLDLPVAPIGALSAPSGGHGHAH